MIKVTDDFAQISKLWNSVFHDDYDYIKFFYDNCMDKYCLGYFIEEKLVSMFLLIGCRIGSYSGEYIFAACTDEKYRNNGYMGELLEYQKNNTDKDFICLVPANESLFDYYSKFQFKTKLYSSEYEDVKNTKIKLSFNEFKEKRVELSNNYSFLIWNDLEFFYNENVYCGGYFFKNENCLMSVRDNKIVERITEKFEYKKKTGMIYSKYDINNTYIGLVLD